MLGDTLEGVLHVMRARNASSLGALILLVLEAGSAFGHEYQLIWKPLQTPRYPRVLINWVYIFARYFGLVAQSINCYLMFWPMSRIPLEPGACRMWLSFQIISAQTLLATLEGVLLLRVYALYNQQRSVALFLVTLFLTDLAVAVIFGIRTLPALNFDAICTGHGAPRDVLYFGVGALSTQILILVMTLRKRRTGWGAPIVSLMVRDGGLVFGFLFAMLSMTVVYSFMQNLAAHVVFFWPISFMSIATCRIIMNMQRLKIPRNTQNSVILTTRLDSTLDTYSRASLCIA